MNTWAEAVEQFNECLNEIEGPKTIAGSRFDASDILRELDPIAYRTYLFDYIDSEGVDSDDFEDDYPL